MGGPGEASRPTQSLAYGPIRSWSKIALASIKGSKVHRGKPPSGPRHNPLVGEPRAYGAKAYAGYNHFPTRPRGNRGRRRKLDVLASHSEESGVEWLTLAVKAEGVRRPSLSL